jgi:hypothetical protein
MEESSKAVDRFLKPYQIGIGCERCHGPGELHVREMKSEKESDYPENYMTIVNPGKLSLKRQLSVCMQCHLQGKAWAMQGPNVWLDFKPGQLLENNRSVYFPEKTTKEVIEVGDSPHRMMLSRCFKESNGSLTCITCHNPHLSIKSFTMEDYSRKCLSCHKPENLPVENVQHKHTKADNCISCHMNRTGTDNTLHGVSLTDHWIRVDANKIIIDWTSLRKPANLGPIIKLTADIDADDKNTFIRKGTGYLDYYLEIDRRKVYLDSALFYLKKDPGQLEKSAIGNFMLGEVYMELNNYPLAIKSFKKATELFPEYADAFFKLGKVYSIQGDYYAAINFYRQAVKLKPDEPPYLESLGAALLETGNIEETIKVL